MDQCSTMDAQNAYSIRYGCNTSQGGGAMGSCDCLTFTGCEVTFDLIMKQDIIIFSTFIR